MVIIKVHDCELLQAESKRLRDVISRYLRQ